MPAPKLLIAASGTGGHVFPALAIAEHLPDWDIEWLGVPDRMEGELVGDRYPLHTVTLSGIQERRLTAWIRSGSQLVGSCLQVRRLLQKGDFQAVLTTGGYIAAPAILAAWSLGIPAVLHESNAIPGKVTRWLGRFCTVVALGVAEAVPYLKGIPTQVVGTPVRSQFWHSDGELALDIPPGAPLITIIGGSQGARGLNRMILSCAPAWLEAGAWIVHLTGTSEAEVVAALAPQHSHYLHRAFWGDMAGLLRRTRFVVSRAGAATLAELAATATPAVLIPYPYAAEDHQFFNANAFARSGAGRVLREGETNVAQLRDWGLEWLADPAELTSLRRLLDPELVKGSGQRMAHLVRSLPHR